MNVRLALLSLLPLLTFALGCPPKPEAPAPPADAAAPAAAAQPPSEPPPPDPELRRVAMLPDPCPGAIEGVQRADPAVLAAPQSAAAHFRLGGWLRLRELSCVKSTTPAQGAATAADAFAAAARLDPSRPEYAVAFAAAAPQSPEAALAIQSVLARDAADPLARLWKAQHGAVPDDQALVLVSGPSPRCAAGQSLLRGDLLRRQGQAREALAAYLRELSSGCEWLGLQWRGAELSRRAAARLGAAQAALLAKDRVEARRQLRWLDWETVVAGKASLDEGAREALWKQLLAGDRSPRVSRPGPTPEHTLRALELALLRGDRYASTALLSGDAEPQRRPACSAYNASREGPHATLPMCILRELLPEAPRLMGCEAPQEGKTTCRVTSRGEGPAWQVKLVQAGGGWKVDSSVRPATTARPVP